MGAIINVVVIYSVHAQMRNDRKIAMASSEGSLFSLSPLDSLTRCRCFCSPAQILKREIRHMYPTHSLNRRPVLYQCTWHAVLQVLLAGPFASSSSSFSLSAVGRGPLAVGVGRGVLEYLYGPQKRIITPPQLKCDMVSPILYYYVCRERCVKCNKAGDVDPITLPFPPHGLSCT